MLLLYPAILFRDVHELHLFVRDSSSDITFNEE